MLRVSPYFPAGDQENERTVMGNEAVAEELAGLDELEALYELNATESDDEDEDEDEYDDEDDDEEEDEEDESE